VPNGGSKSRKCAFVLVRATKACTVGGGVLH